MFAVAAVVALAAGYALGEAVGPIDSPPPPAHGAEEADVTTRAKTSSEPTRAAHDSHARTSPVGGYRIVAAPMSATAGVSQTLRFQVIDPSGSVVTDFAVRHGKRMHLVVVSSDVTRYAHLHPSSARTASGRSSSRRSTPAGTEPSPTLCPPDGRTR